ncbi:MAG: polysaccharide ABC transporter ATP-binding protein [Chitinophagaceae bacterium]
MDDAIIKVEGLGKKYIISHEGRENYTALRDVISRKTKNLLKKKEGSASSTEEFWALKDVNFAIKRGEAVGIIGRNGAGKSTLLKILSRITEPSTGRIEMNGRVASLLEVGTGFHPELTGRENIYLNGAILGMSRAEIKRKFDEIVDFSGVEKFLDTPVKRYSSGMYVRLAFAVAAHLEPEILVVDEVLAVGDAEFQKKCLGKMNEVSRNDGRTVLFVSHDINAITQLCKRSVLLKKGQVELIDDTLSVVSKYMSDQKSASTLFDGRVTKKPVYFKNIEIVDEQWTAKSEFLVNDQIHFLFTTEINDPTIRCNIFIVVLDNRKKRIFACESENVKNSMRLTLEGRQLVRGEYSINAYINIPGVNHLDIAEDICHFNIIDDSSEMLKHGTWDYGNVFGRYKWIDNSKQAG